MSRQTIVACVFVLGGLAASAGAAHAQTRLTLDEAVSRGMAHAPRLVEARARTEAARAGIDTREAQSAPMLTASSGYLRTNHVEEFGIRQPDGSLRVLFPDIPSNYRARAELGVPLYTGGRVRSAVDAARAELDAAGADARAQAADVELEVVTAYWALATAQARVAVLERAEERADRIVADVGARVDAGLLPPNDRLSAQAQRARQRVQLIQARNDRALAEAALARWIGADPSERLEPVTPVNAPMAGADVVAGRALDQLIEQATKARPERQALTSRVRGLRDSANALFGATRPQVSAVAAIEPARPNPRFVPRTDRWHTSWDLGVTMAWSIWDGGRSRADRAVVTAQADALAARVAEFDSLVALEIRQRLLDIGSARAALSAVAEAIEAATEARRVVGERFAVGVALASDVLESDLAVLEAELERARIEAAMRVAEARLMRAAGGR
jgi:outer membrane protein